MSSEFPSKKRKIEHVAAVSEDVSYFSPSEFPNLLFDHIGVANCELLCRLKEKACFVDKSMIIEEILQSSQVVNVILRPPHFGKSLNLLILHGFFDVNSPCRQMFNGLLIEKNHPEYFGPHGPFGSHPVILVDLKDASWKTNLAKVHKQFDYLLQSDELTDFQKMKYKRCGPNSTQLVKVLSSLLHLHHKSPCVILVDNYDSVVYDILREEAAKDATSFLFDLFVSFLLGNESNIFKVVIMGVCYYSCWDEMNMRWKRRMELQNNKDSEGLPFAPEQYQIRVHTWREAAFSDHFGFSEKEVTQLLNCHGCSADVPEVLSFYSGYRTRKGLTMSNPYSIMEYLTDRSIQPYLSQDMLMICELLYPELFRLLEERCSPSPSKGVPADCRYPMCLGPYEPKGFWEATYSDPRAFFFGFLGLSDEYNFNIPTLEALHSWIVSAFTCGETYEEKEENGSFDQLVSDLFNPLYENMNLKTLQTFRNMLQHRLSLLHIHQWDIEERCCTYLLSLSLLVDASMKRFHAHVSHTNESIRVVIVDDKTRGFIFEFALAKCIDVTDETAILALANSPEVTQAYLVGIGMNYSECSVVCHLLKKDTNTGKWLREISITLPP